MQHRLNLDSCVLSDTDLLRSPVWQSFFGLDLDLSLSLARRGGWRRLLLGGLLLLLSDVVVQDIAVVADVVRLPDDMRHQLSDQLFDSLVDLDGQAFTGGLDFFE